MKLIIDDAQHMEKLGGLLIEGCPQGGLVFLKGNLGAGKTTLVRGLLRAVGYEGNVKSPTYTLIESYDINGRTIHHLDLYRLGDPEELEYLGVRELSDARSLCLIEWPEKAAEHVMSPDLVVEIDYAGQGRQVKIVANTSVGQKMVDHIRTHAQFGVA